MALRETLKLYLELNFIKNFKINPHYRVMNSASFDILIMILSSIKFKFSY